MNTVLIHSDDEYTRETIKSALANHLPLIVTEDRGQCLAALRQKAPIKKSFIGVCSAERAIDLELFEEAAALRPGLKMIAVGDQDTEDAAIEAVRRGATGYIIMPIKADELLATAR